MSVYAARLPPGIVVEAELLRNSAFFWQAERLPLSGRALTLHQFLMLSLFESETLPAIRKLTVRLRENYEPDLFGPALALLVTGKFTKADEDYRASGGSLVELPQEAVQR